MPATIAPRKARGGDEGSRYARVNEVQRARVISALVELVVRDGVHRPTIAQIIARARVSRKTFYELFDGHEACFIAAMEQPFAAAQALALEAYAEQRGWRESMRAAVTCLLELIDAHPSLARLCLLHAPAAGSAVYLRRDQLVRELADAVDIGHRANAIQLDLPEMTTEAVLGGIVAVVNYRLMQNDPRPLSELAGQVMSMIVLPCLGPQAACEEHRRAYEPARRPVPRTIESRDAQPQDPLMGVSIRLTYRTVRVLLAIASSPGISNRTAAQSAGIVDQGQISKLLSRLAALGLIENARAEQRRSGPNAWSLTAQGRRLVRASRPSGACAGQR